MSTATVILLIYGATVAVSYFLNLNKEGAYLSLSITP